MRAARDDALDERLVPRAAVDDVLEALRRVEDDDLVAPVGRVAGPRELRHLLDGELVAAGSGVDACVGDSGGPLVDEDGVVIGIVARGLDGESACGAGGVYTRVAALRAWMEESSAVPDNEEVCEGCGGCRSAGGGAWLWVAGLAVLVRRRRGSTPQFARH